MKEKILTILEEVTGTSEVREDLDMHLFDAGVLDSMGCVMLLVNVEQELGKVAPISEFEREEWETPNKIIEKVDSLQDA